MKRLTLITSCILLLFTGVLHSQTKECTLYFSYEQIDQYHVQMQAVSTPDSLDYIWESSSLGNYTGENPIIEIIPGSLPFMCISVLNDSLGCGETCDTIYTIFEDCNADFNIAEGSNALNRIFTSQSSGEDPINHRWEISGNEVGNTEILNYEFSEYGTYNICLIIETDFGCIDTTCQEITLIDTTQCEVNFNTMLNYQFAEFTAEASGAVPYTYLWTINDEPVGNQSQLSYEFPATGSYSVCVNLLTSTGCETNSCETISITEIQPYYSISGQVLANENLIDTEIHCYKNDQLLISKSSNAGQFEFSPLFPGEYKLLAISPNSSYYDTWFGNKLNIDEAWTIYLEGNTWDIDIHLQNTQSSVPDINSTVKIHPNPVINELLIQTDRVIEKVSILNIKGQIIDERFKNINRIDMTHLSAGIYLLEIQTKNTTSMHKIIKQ